MNQKFGEIYTVAVKHSRAARSVAGIFLGGKAKSKRKGSRIFSRGMGKFNSIKKKRAPKSPKGGGAKYLCSNPMLRF